MKRRLFVILFLSICTMGLGQNEDLRLRALQYFCDKKQILFPTENIPIFFINAFIYEDGQELMLEPHPYFRPDSLMMFQQINNPRHNDTIIPGSEFASANGGIKLEHLSDIHNVCSCVYQSWQQFEDCEDFYVQNVIGNCCIREYKLNVSNVMSYNGRDYVVLQQISFFLGNFTEMKYIIFEFLEDELQMCYASNTWIP